MRVSLLPAVLLLAVLPPAALRADEAATDATADQLRLADGRTMAGSFLDFAPEKGLRFLPRGASKELQVPADGLDALVPRRTPAAKAAAPTAKAPAAGWRITLNNGDFLVGRLASLSAGKLALEAPWGGPLEIAPSALAMLVPPGGPGTGDVGAASDWRGEAGSPLFLKGLGGGGGPPATVVVEDGQLAVPASGVSRALGMKAGSRLDLTLEGSRQFNLELLSDPTPEGKELSCTFLFARDRVSTQQSVLEKGRLGIGRPDIVRMEPKDGPMEVSLRANAQGGQIVLWVNGARICSVNLPVETCGKRLFLQRAEEDVRLTRLSFLQDATGFDDPAAPRGTDDTANLANGDKLGGTLLGISGGKAAFKTQDATLSLPVARLRGITLSAAHDLAQPAGQGTVRVHLGAAGRLTLRAVEIKDGRITGKADGIGEVALPLAAARLLEFNPGAAHGGAKPR